MNRHQIYHLHLSTQRAVALGVGLSVLGLLAFVGGFVLGIGQERADLPDLAAVCRGEVRQACGDPVALAAWRGEPAADAEAEAEPAWPEDWDAESPEDAQGVDPYLPEDGAGEMWYEEVPPAPEAWEPEPADTADPRQLAELMDLALREDVDQDLAEPAPRVPAPRSHTEPPSATASRRAPYTVQVGAFRELENAHHFVTQLSERQYRPYLHVRDDPQGRRWHTVRLADFDTRPEAIAAARDFQQRESLDAVVRAKDPF